MAETIRVELGQPPAPLPSTWLSWRPTSAAHLAAAEARVLRQPDSPLGQCTTRSVRVGTTRGGWFSSPQPIHVHEVRLGDRGPELLMLHGMAGGAGLWAANLRELAEGGFRVRAIDLPGFGRSDRPAFEGAGDDADAGEEFFMSALESYVAATPELAARPFWLLGHSFGGYLAGVYSLRHPEQIRHAVLADAWGMPERDPVRLLLPPSPLPLPLRPLTQTLRRTGSLVRQRGR